MRFGTLENSEFEFVSDWSEADASPVFGFRV
jgi:hypothetical protein